MEQELETPVQFLLDYRPILATLTCKGPKIRLISRRLRLLPKHALDSRCIAYSAE